jgi:putative protease
MRQPGKPEIMSPAGYWPQLRAAIEAGADAVYFGLKHFTARAKVGFSLAELPEALQTLHGRGVKGYVTFNTLVFDHELGEAARAIAAIARAGADAIIVQDVAVARLAKEIAPDLKLHASTQMSVADAAGVRLAQQLGASRVTLARELSLDEIRAIRAQTGCELEIFVHGALCVAYSGQCLSSEAWGGRSANRGQCAQACRLPYDMLVDGSNVPLGDARYLLSPGDLYALRQVPELLTIGLHALKIEGRYKDADYVALATRAYRKAVDEALVGPEEELQLQQVYSRGLGPHFLSGTNHQKVVQGRAPRHRGVLAGRVLRGTGDSVVVEPAGAIALKAGDGVVFDAAGWRSPEEAEEGGRVYSVASRRGAVELRFANNSVDFRRIRPGDLVWRTHDPNVEKAARPFTHAAAPVRKQPVSVRVIAAEGEPLRTEWLLQDLLVVASSSDPLRPAQRRAITEEFLRDQLGRLGNTPYELGALTLEIRGAPFAPVSALNDLRRQAVAQLQARQSAPRAMRLRDPEHVWRGLSPAPAAIASRPPDLHLLVRTPEQLEAALGAACASITLDYLDLFGLRPSVERVKAAGIAVRVASPRVLKPGEGRIVDFLLRLNCPILVRPAGLLELLRGGAHPELTGDFSLNAANAIAARLFLERGLARITPAHDLNAAQVAAMAHTVGGAAIEAVAYQHLPVFHTEHCVFCRFLSQGASYLDCGRPCEKHRVELRDAAGRAHPVMADVGCRNTVFGAEAQHAAAHLNDWLNAGIGHFRLEFVHESAGQVERVSGAFAGALTGSVSARDLARELRRASPQGTTQGSLYVAPGYMALPVLQ